MQLSAEATSTAAVPEIVPPPASDAEKAGLEYVNDDAPGLRRRRAGSGFSYLDSSGRVVREAATLARIRSLAVPPAWTDVWICSTDLGHLQATGRDAKRRKQYRYHADFIAIRDSVKYERLVDFARSLPAIRARVSQDMSAAGLPRKKVLATIVHLLDSTLIRVGNDSYARDNDSYGITTLRNAHVRISGGEFRFQFKGKSGKTWRLTMRDRRVAKIIRSCQELPGQHLFQYLDEGGNALRVTSTDVNGYLREVTGGEVTAKDFRTWAGTVLAAELLQAAGRPASVTAGKRQIREALRQVAARLGNTIEICRKCYVHPAVLEAYLAGELRLRHLAANGAATLRTEEAATLRFLRRRTRQPSLR